MSSEQEESKKSGFAKYETVQNIFKGKNERECESCHKIGQMKRCAKCHTVFYCSRECQAADWPKHKVTCKQITTPWKSDFKMQDKQEFAQFFLSRMNYMKNVAKQSDKRDKNGVRLSPPQYSSALGGRRQEPPSPLRKRKTKYPPVVAELKHLGGAMDKALVQALQPEHVCDVLDLLFDQRLDSFDLRCLVLRALTAPHLQEELKKHYDEGLLSWFDMDVDPCDSVWSTLANVELLNAMKKVLLDRANAPQQRRNAIVDAVGKIGQNRKDLKKQCVEIVVTAMQNDPLWEDPVFMGLCVSSLLNWKATDQLPVIRKVYELNCVDLDMCGGYVAALRALKLPIDESDELVKRYWTFDQRDMSHLIEAFKGGL